MMTSPNLPVYLASLCAILYESEEVLAEALDGDGFENVRVVSHEDITAAFAVGVLDGQRVNLVVVEGSDSVADWTRYNLKTPMTQLPVGGVHGGFCEATVAFAYLWRAWIETLAPDDRVNPYVITGHSLGGAIAQVFAGTFGNEASQEAGLHIRRVITFGQPRVGDKPWAENYNRWFGGVTTRYVYRHDIVTTLPPYLHGYRHAGREVLLESSKFAWLLWSVASVFPKLLTRRMDHNIDNYVRALAVH